MEKELMEIYQQFVDLDEEERAQRAAYFTRMALDNLKKYVEDDNAVMGLFLALVGAAVNADSVVSNEERMLFNELCGTEYSMEDFSAAMKSLGNQFDDVNEVVDKLDDDTKYALCSVFLAFLSADGRLTTGEVEKFETLLF